MPKSLDLHRARHALPLAAAVLASSVAPAASRADERPVALPGDRAYPESIASTADGTLYVGSFAEGGVTRIKPGGKPEIWIKPGASGTRSTFGVLAEEAADRLWVCSNDVSAFGVPGPSDVKGSFLKAFDLKSGAEVASAELPGKGAFCNDIAIGPDGAAYVTNSRAPEILRLASGAKALEVWKSDPLFAPPAKGAGLDGLAFADDGTLYVDTFNKAELFAVSVANGKAGDVKRLEPSQPLTLADALRPTEGGAFLMIEGAGRLDRVRFSGDTATIEVLKDGFIGPTGVTQAGATAWVAEGQLPFLIDPSKKGQGPKLPFHVYPVPLKTP